MPTFQETYFRYIETRTASYPDDSRRKFLRILPTCCTTWSHTP